MKKFLDLFALKSDQNFNPVYQKTITERLWIAIALFVCGFFAVQVKLISLMLSDPKKNDFKPIDTEVVYSRADIVDRSGVVLATHLTTGSIYVNPKQLHDPKHTAAQLSKIFPDLKAASLMEKLSAPKSFVWIKRHVSPVIQQKVHNLGIPGLYIQKDEKRIYPFGRSMAHVLGYCGLDNIGLAGVEKNFDLRLRENQSPLHLTLDIRIQHILFDEMSKAIETFQAEAGNALIMHIPTGEIYGMVSFPTFDPNRITEKDKLSIFNRNTQGTYEPGSIWKAFTCAIALDTKVATLKTLFDARFPMKIGPHLVSDFRGKNRFLTLEEVFVYSSNLGCIRASELFGKTNQQTYLKRFGLFDKPTLELSEVAYPQVPQNWSDVTRMTISYGYGMAVTPIHNVNAFATLLNGGRVTQATLIKTDKPLPKDLPTVISPRTSEIIKRLMRLVVLEGSAKAADVKGYRVMGKTGTAYKSMGRKGYGTVKKRLTTVIAAFSYPSPQYLLLVSLDDPKASKETHGFATAGWNAAPTAGKIIERVACVFNIAPVFEDSDSNEENKGKVKENVE